MDKYLERHTTEFTQEKIGNLHNPIALNKLNSFTF